VRAQDAAGNLSGYSSIASATTQAEATNPPGFVAINIGGPSYTAGDGTVYAADTSFTGGSIFTVSNAIANTTDDALYQSERYGAFSYNIPLTSGTYDVTLKFAEIYVTAAGERVFHVDMEGTRVLSNFDIFAAAGGSLIAYDRTFPVSVTDGMLTVTFTSVVENPKISAIKIAPASQYLQGDLNQDGTVNSADWTIMAGVWFTNDATADLNGDGIVNSIDFSLMNANWGKTI